MVGKKGKSNTNQDKQVEQIEVVVAKKPPINPKNPPPIVFLTEQTFLTTLINEKGKGNSK